MGVRAVRWPGGPPASAPASAVASGCLVDNAETNGTDATAAVIDFGVGGSCADVPIPFEVSATLNGQTRTLGVPAAPGGWESVQLDPCGFSAGSDLPGTQLLIQAVGLHQGQRIPGLEYPGGGTITLGADTLAPRLTVQSMPAKGTRVKAGDVITVKVTAEEQRGGGPWQTGVKRIKVNAAPVGLILDDENPAPSPQPCAAKAWSRTTTASYTVPSNPPPTVSLCVLAQDYAGMANIKCAAFPTTISIAGSNELHEKQTASGTTETVDIVATFSATAGAGNRMTGTAQITGQYSVNGSCSWSTGKLTWTAALDGTFEERADRSVSLLLLAVPATSPSVTIDFSCGAPVPANAPFSIPWQGVYGLTLVNGLLNTSQFIPAAPGETGGETITWHIELAP